MGDPWGGIWRITLENDGTIPWQCALKTRSICVHAQDSPGRKHGSIAGRSLLLQGLAADSVPACVLGLIEHVVGHLDDCIT